MMAAMPAAELGLLAYLDRPATNSLVVAALALAAGWAFHVWAEWSTRSIVDEPRSDARPEPLDDGAHEAPAIVALLTNSFDVPPTAVTATALDLAARGWVRFTVIDGELVVMTRGTGSEGDTLQPFEQQVLNHLAARAFNDATSAGTLAASHHRLDRRWRLRFDRSVAAAGAELDLCRRRYTTLEIAPPAACSLIATIAAWMAINDGSEVAVADSWRPRAIWFVLLAAVAVLAWRTIERAIGAAQRATEAGAERATDWLGYRSRLRARIPAHASVLAPPPQQIALAHAVVMGVAAQVLNELPVAPDDPHQAWSEAGNRAHTVKVRYPVRPGYGQHPVRVGLTGVVVLVLVRWLQGFLRRVSEGDALESLLERVPGQIDLIEQIAEILSIVCWLPLAWSAWAIVAGAVDSVVTRERVGFVVRTRRPIDVLPAAVTAVVKPFAERDRFSTYLAVDDGKRVAVTAWLASERTAAPQGAQAQVRATPLLGYVRSSEPVGTATRT